MLALLSWIFRVLVLGRTGKTEVFAVDCRVHCECVEKLITDTNN